MVIVAPEPSLGGHSNEQQAKREAKRYCSYHGFLLLEVTDAIFLYCGVFGAAGSSN
jgi:hypothetical protein